MDRSAKGIRIAGALLLFVNLAVFFLPMTKIVPIMEQRNFQHFSIYKM